MGNWSEQQAAKKETRERDKISRETLGKYFYDLSKLSFGAMVLGVVVPWFANTSHEKDWILLSIGIVTTFLFAISGYNTIKK